MNSSSNHHPLPATDQSTLACLAHVPCHGLRLARSSFPSQFPARGPTHDMSGNDKRSKRLVPREVASSVDTSRPFSFHICVHDNREKLLLPFFRLFNLQRVQQFSVAQSQEHTLHRSMVQQRPPLGDRLPIGITRKLARFPRS